MGKQETKEATNDNKRRKLATEGVKKDRSRLDFMMWC